MQILCTCDEQPSLNDNYRHRFVVQVVDSRARTNADGALQQQARRQLEVFQSQIPGAHLQVIKTQSFSTSRWSHNQSNHLTEIPVKDFENLQVGSIVLKHNCHIFNNNCFI